ncbi:HPr family phosphocarrier protein [Vibrio sp. V27_P1S3P104]|uniref:HPr family phosphocarrier protein n=1 Tax=Vibrio TaxID=662 RepID=UPI000C164446|nr:MULTISPECIES: HPr family phosphocarrier protein [Vibrio]NAW67765.1 HPr family phosphocarrier protein [Vibrio sp. V28_P6S34P95]NAX05692.1 HPr family phosphocarrier protein [Vibrio sp. V30_P3S12P165]NAX34479.1 HPr family phosphocarrier protein [Vibrio sp. V29_P1S30P107]NAX35921.1 HPr family phosphocarrier protein [Vibrio sp. V27_P1S3P104]NAX40742.1 HPr family phosphocarrier protein [Vibrio sp. V26_P1S5P106]
MSQISRQVLIQNRLGLHARAAVKLVELAQSFDAIITIQGQEGKQATADSVMGLLMLDSAQGQMITISAQGPQAAVALDAVCHLIEVKFDEDD